MSFEPLAGVEPWYWLVLGFVAVSRLSELVVSRRNRQRMMSEHGAAPGRDPIFPLMVYLHVMPFWIIPAELWVLQPKFIPAVGIPALIVFLLAQAMRVWVLTSLRGYWNAQVMVPPDLDPVTVGPYQYIRHPNYVVVILELLTLPLIHTAWVSALLLTLLNAFVLYFRISDEERLLFRSPDYREKMGHKPRFIPGVV